MRYSLLWRASWNRTQSASKQEVWTLWAWLRQRRASSICSTWFTLFFSNEQTERVATRAWERRKDSKEFLRNEMKSEATHSKFTSPRFHFPSESIAYSFFRTQGQIINWLNAYHFKRKIINCKNGLFPQEFQTHNNENKSLSWKHSLAHSLRNEVSLFGLLLKRFKNLFLCLLNLFLLV